jgi:2-polyprenyl-3-methyl-5-hydroxy-6-metoxy-1,4-benzoquinol methylase
MTASTRPVVVIGAPVYGDVGPDILEDWMRFMYHCGRRLPQYDFHLAIVPKSEQFRARNAIVHAAQQVNADWLLMLDDDMIINTFVTQNPTDDYGFLERLIAHNKDLCGALYYQRVGACSPVLMKAIDEKGYRFLRDDELTGGLQRVDVAGGGCLLMRMAIFDRLPLPYFAPEFEYGTDIQLCRSAAAHGFEVWADTSIELGHVRVERTVITKRNRREFQLTDPVQGDIKRQFVTSHVYDRLVQDAADWTGYLNVDAMTRVSQNFLQERLKWQGTDAEWYRMYPKERVARQVWFNTQMAGKRQMTEFILAAVSDTPSHDVLDFGCGIGIPAFTFAERGHRVTAVDIAGTGTFEFLKWRAKQYKLELTTHDSQGGVPHLGGAQFDVIVAMDSIEHIAEWRMVVRELGAHLRPGGVLFSNNAILEDDVHPEHYHIDHKEFIDVCMAADLMPYNPITYLKRAESPRRLAVIPPVEEAVHA